MKKICTTLLSLLLLLYPLLAGAEETTPITNEQRIDFLTAVSLDIVPEGMDPGAPCTFSEFYAMLNAAVKLKAGKAAEWYTWPSNGEDSDPLPRVYAARLLYEGAMQMGYEMVPTQEPQKNAVGKLSINGNNYAAEGDVADYDLFNWTWAREDAGVDAVMGDWTTYPTDWFVGYAIRQESSRTGRKVMELTADDRFRPFEPLTHADAAAAVLRLYESTFDRLMCMIEEEHERVLDASPNAEVQSILDDAKQWRERFATRRTEARYIGNVYYVSNNGSDKANGKTPETTFATIEHALGRKLKAGDAILLERGSQWHVPVKEKSGLNSSAYWMPKGVTLGAYGDGARPVLRGDAEDASVPENWTLYSDRDGARIWVFHRPMREVNVIVFNGGEQWADRIIPCLRVSDLTYTDWRGQPFVVEEALMSDLTYCILHKLEPDDIGDVANSTVRGELYLRCDAGNPAEVFREVAVPQVPVGLTTEGKNVIVGIDLRYFTCMAAGLGNSDGYIGFRTLADSEVSWCGGLMRNYHEENSVDPNSKYAVPEGILFPYCAGGALFVSGGDITITDCLIHDCGPMALIVSMHVSNEPEGVITYANSTFRNNQFVRCGGVFHWADLTWMDSARHEGFLSNYVYEGNTVLYTGYGWPRNLIWQTSPLDADGLPRFTEFNCAVENMMSAANNDGIYFRDNTFCFAQETLIGYQDEVGDGTGVFANARPVFEGNTYVQWKDKALAFWNRKQLIYDGQTLLDTLNDSSGRVIRME